MPREWASSAALASAGTPARVASQGQAQRAVGSTRLPQREIHRGLRNDRQAARGMTTSQVTDLETRCDLLRSLHRSGDPLVLPNVWDVATARAVVAAGFAVVATTSGGVAATLGHEDGEGAPAEEMFAAAARIVRSVDVPVTVDAEAGYGM